MRCGSQRSVGPHAGIHRQSAHVPNQTYTGITRLGHIETTLSSTAATALFAGSSFEFELGNLRL